jgi:hypothetical protein
VRDIGNYSHPRAKFQNLGYQERQILPGNQCEDPGFFRALPNHIQGAGANGTR